MIFTRNNQLTDRECQITCYILQGKANKYIAAELGVSQRTIEAHRSRIFMKLGVRNAIQLASIDDIRAKISTQCSADCYFVAPLQLDRYQLGASNEPAVMVSGHIHEPRAKRYSG